MEEPRAVFLKSLKYKVFTLNGEVLKTAEVSGRDFSGFGLTEILRHLQICTGAEVIGDSCAGLYHFQFICLSLGFF